MPSWIKTTSTARPRPYTREKRTLRYPLVDDELALLWMANMGCIDMNTWYSRVDTPSRPDWVLFDLDPSPDVGFPEVVQVALLIKDVLDTLGLPGFRRPAARTASTSSRPDRAGTPTTGLGSSPRSSPEPSRDYCSLVTTEWAKASGAASLSTRTKTARARRSRPSTRFDRGRERRSPRPSAGRRSPRLEPAAFTMEVALDRVQRHGDLFEGVLTTHQSLGDALSQLR